MTSFWEALPRPFFVLAPMADVTDPAYRRLIAETAPPHATWTEFVSADGLFFTREKKGMNDADNPLMRDLGFTEAERPVVAQLFTSRPESMAYAAKLCADLGFDGIDINMGCPDKSIEKQGAGAAMIKDMAAAREVIAAARESGLPVSVKTRLGYGSVELDTWIGPLLTENLSALSVHLRTRKEMSKVAAHWELVPEIVRIRNEISPKTLVIGNGDLYSIAHAMEMLSQSGADGAMLGRAIFGNPWVFQGRVPEDVPAGEKLEALQRLAEYYSELSPGKSFHLLKKHFKAFVTGWEGAAELRRQLMETQSVPELLGELTEARRLV